MHLVLVNHCLLGSLSSLDHCESKNLRLINRYVDINEWNAPRCLLLRAYRVPYLL